MDEERKFKVMDGGRLKFVPWSLVYPHRAQAEINHYQDLTTLHLRGGLAPSELIAVLEDRRWHKMPQEEAIAKIEALLTTPDVTV